MVKFLHTSDWQIGRTYSWFAPEDATTLSEARLGAVRAIASLATQLGSEAVLVAGDVFDAQTVSDRTLRQLFNALEGFPGPWVLIPGNHDAALAESVWARAQRLNCIPANVHFIQAVECRTFPDLRLAVLAAPLTQRQTTSDLTAGFPDMETPAGFFRVGIAHGSLQGVIPEEADSANPIAADRETTACLDYLALGDWHGLKQVAPRTWYSGTPERDRFKGNAPGYILEVEITSPGADPVVTTHRVGQFEWHLHEAELRVPSDLDELAEYLGGLAGTDVLRLKVSGRIDLAGLDRLDVVLGEAEGRLRSLQVDRSGLQFLPTEEDIRALHVDGYLDEVLKELKTGQEGYPTEEKRQAATDALVELAGILRARNAQGVQA